MRRSISILVAALAALGAVAAASCPQRDRGQRAGPSPEERVDVVIHDSAGRLVRLERLGPPPAGVHGWTWDGRDSGGRSLAAGAYFVRLLAGRHFLHPTIMRLAP